MELSAFGERVFAAESITKRRIAYEGRVEYRVKWNGWSQNERVRELFGPKKRGPKPETFLLKAKAKSYECRRQMPRAIRVSYLVSEPFKTTRAREGLRTVVHSFRLARSTEERT
ncbi:hypothetical protein UPYG_G00103730 [Umbra pygmaea]|uniref:Chromo domain-containing protein n=1 Tax=Umbra pygmaea TaxID=75934 RepID=A0ABD0X568_UMBPY